MPPKDDTNNSNQNTTGAPADTVPAIPTDGVGGGLGVPKPTPTEPLVGSVDQNPTGVPVVDPTASTGDQNWPKPAEEGEDETGGIPPTGTPAAA